MSCNCIAIIELGHPKGLKMRSFARVTALRCAYILTALAFFSMPNYLTTVWKLNVSHAAGIVNFWKGISMISTILLHITADTVFENYKILLASSYLYSMGIGFVTMSTPPVLAKATGTCKSYAPECIGQAQQILFYMGMTMIAVGIAGNQNNSVATFLKEQNEEIPDIDIEENVTRCGYLAPLRRCCQVQTALMVLVAAIVGAIALPYVKPWNIRFAIPAIFTVLATLFFTTGWKSFRRVKPKGSPVTKMCRVFVAAAFKLSQPFPPSSEGYYKKEGEQVTDFSPTHVFRWLHKASIIVHSDLSEDKKLEKRWRLCSVEEVEDAIIALRLAPMWMMLIVCGMVESAGSTYFVEQASTMDPKLGKLKLSPQIFLLVQWSARKLIGWWAQALLKSRWKGAPAIGIGVAMISSVLCCIAAAVVETERLKIVRRRVSLDKPEGVIPMSMCWLLFQFILLAIMKSFIEKSIAAFYYVEKAPPEPVINIFSSHNLSPGFEEEASLEPAEEEASLEPVMPSLTPTEDQKCLRVLCWVYNILRRSQVERGSTTNYIKEITKGACGLGYMFSVLAVYVVGKASEAGGHASWFQPSLNQSRLDRYFWVLTTLSSLNLVVFIFMASYYTYQNR